MPRYWIGVVSRLHVRRGVEGGIAQLGHGRKAPLRRLARGDWLVYYSPRTSHPDGEPLRAFTAIGRVEGRRAGAGRRRGEHFTRGAVASPTRRLARFLLAS